MTELNNIINSLQSLFESESGYKISKNSGVPYQNSTRFKKWENQTRRC